MMVLIKYLYATVNVFKMWWWLSPHDLQINKTICYMFLLLLKTCYMTVNFLRIVMFSLKSFVISVLSFNSKVLTVPVTYLIQFQLV